MLDVLVVLDGLRIERSAYFGIATSLCLCGDRFRYWCAVPDDRELSFDWTDLKQATALEIFRIPNSEMVVRGRVYRILNKVIATREAPFSDGVLVDSDTCFFSAPNKKFLVRDRTAATPEHNPLPVPDAPRTWTDLFSFIGLEEPVFEVRYGSGKYGFPYFNAGVVASPDLKTFGKIWLSVCEEVNKLDLEISFPYLDQLALPIALAKENARGAIDFNNVLPREFNYNLYHFQDLAEVDRGAVIYHHHDRISIVRSILGRRFDSIARRFPLVKDLLPELAEGEFRKFARLIS